MRKEICIKSAINLATQQLIFSGCAMEDFVIQTFLLGYGPFDRGAALLHGRDIKDSRRVCSESIKKQHPFLDDLSVPDEGSNDFRKWTEETLQDIRKKHGDTLRIVSIDEWERAHNIPAKGPTDLLPNPTA